MRLTVALIAPLGALFLSACTPAVPDSGAGVGFTDYNTYIRGAQPAPAPVVTQPAGTFTPSVAAAAIDRAAGVPATAPAPAPTYQPPAPRPAAPAATYQPAPTQPGIAHTGTIDCGVPEGIAQTTTEMDNIPQPVSDEQDFEAVKTRETIESDKRRIECNRAKYQIDQPGAVPQRQGDNGPNIAQYALSTSHAPGTQVYKRSGLNLSNPQRACAKFPSPDKAQEEFLRAGGPQRDRKGLDPDGDGFACDWDPRPFRAALQ